MIEIQEKHLTHLLKLKSEFDKEYYNYTRTKIEKGDYSRKEMTYELAKSRILNYIDCLEGTVYDKRELISQLQIVLETMHCIEETKMISSYTGRGRRFDKKGEDFLASIRKIKHLLYELERSI